MPLPLPAKGGWFILLFLAAGAGQSQTLPKWELGVGSAAAQLPDYRGSSQYRNLAAPFPLARYRGRKVLLDEEGAHRYLYKSEDVIVDISLAAGLPVAREERGVRAGMPGLAPVAEVGPYLGWIASGDRYTGLSLNLPLRAAYSAEWEKVRYVGRRISPYLYLYKRRYAPHRREMGVSVGGIYASRRYHEYYYGVPSDYATAERPAWRGRAGYSGGWINVYAHHSWGRAWVSGFFRLDLLQGAVFRDSPLLERQQSRVLGVVVGWYFSQSAERVSVERERF